MRAGRGQAPLSLKQPRNFPGSERVMSRILLICSFASLLGACGARTAQQNDWDSARLACADVGIAPGSGAFDQCVFDLYYSLWDLQNERES